MSSFDRRNLLLGCSALLSMGACNFTPVYGPGGSGSILRNQIRVAAPDTRLEFELVGRLEDRLGTGSTYDLNYSLSVGQRALAIDGSDNIVRFNLIGTLIYTVTHTATGRSVDQGDVSSFTAYATTTSPVATASARRDAEDRLAVILADQTVTRLIARAPDWS